MVNEGSSFQVGTSRGTFHAGRVVNAAGAKAGEIAAMLGVEVEIDGFPCRSPLLNR
jgi:glycine/D-amino acid oxidase-like deaminating enzyme